MAAMLRLLWSILPTAMAVGPGNPTLYCFALVTPNTYEPNLIVGQWRLKAGIFECDKFDIFTNVSAWELFKDNAMAAEALAPHVKNIGIELFAPMVAGPPGTDKSSPDEIGKKGMKHLANTPVFETLWKHVCDASNYRHYSYTAKVDVDTVLLPSRLSRFLYHRKPRAEYFFNVQNDMYGNFLHGPVELLSLDATLQLCSRSEACKSHISQKAYGEDFYLNECLKYLGVPAVKGMNLLYDMYSYGSYAKKQCTALVPDKVVSKRKEFFAAYHPYKNIDGWIHCREQARVGHPLTSMQIALARRDGHKGPQAPPVRFFDAAEVLPRRWQSFALPVLVGLSLMSIALGLHRLHTNRARKLAEAPLSDPEKETEVSLMSTSA